MELVKDPRHILYTAPMFLYESFSYLLSKPSMLYSATKTIPKFFYHERSSSMFRLWAKEFKDNRMLRDTVVCDDSNDTRTHKVFNALDRVCYEFDLSKPIWLDSTINEFKRHAKARFYQDNFVDSIEFDYLEIHIIEED